MKTTANFGLKKPEENEFYDVNVQNDNMDDIDRVLQEYKDGTQQVGDSAKLGGKDASEYFTKNGGTVDGNVIATSSEATSRMVKAENALKAVALYIDKSGVGGLFDSINGKWILQNLLDGTNTFNGTASGNLPLSGGKISDIQASPLGLNCTATDTNTVFLQFLSNGVNVGHIGFNGANNLIMRSTDAKYYSLLHTGNKPSGSYTGNGSATPRTIDTGGIGNVCTVQSVNGFAIAFQQGSITFYGGGYAWDSNLSFVNGKLIIQSDNFIYNSSGVNYIYQVL